MQEWQVIFMATDITSITNVFPSFSLSIHSYRPLNSIDPSQLILRAFSGYPIYAHRSKEIQKFYGITKMKFYNIEARYAS